MIEQIHEIRPIDLRAASPEEYASLNSLKNALRLETLPDDPPFPCEEDTHRFQAMPALVDNTAWAAREPSQGRILALGQANIYQTGDNPHVVWFSIEVLPDARRRGLARGMLRLVTEHARARGRRLLVGECNDRIPAGQAFLERIGARKGLDEPINQLRLAELDRRLVRTWMERETELSREFTLGFLGEPYPEQRLQDLADLMQEVANDQPRDTLELEDINYTPELVRQFDNEQRAGGDQRWTLCLSRRSDDRLAGISEVYWNPNRPSILWQGFTGVMPEHRSRGLGRWIKAAMLMKVLRERPEVQFIRAGNADSNAPMLKINRALGFKRYVAWTIWQVDVDTLDKYLSAST